MLGIPPIRYLTGWRMHVAEDLLRATDLGLVAVARKTGYDSEEAFSRAFKRLHRGGAERLACAAARLSIPEVRSGYRPSGATTSSRGRVAAG